jgi:FixJ family two-component response regulator
MTQCTVHVIDDDLSVRCAVARLLRSHDQRVRTYPSAREFLSQQLDARPSCVVLDLQMPEMSGLDLQEMLTRGHESLSIVFISGHADIPDSVRAMKAGAVDFLTKPFDEHQLLAAVDAALSRSRQACSNRDALHRDRAIFETLTPREREVCVRVAQGMLNKQIGGEFGTAEKTIKVQRGRVMQKLGAQSVTDVVRLIERLRVGGHLPPLNYLGNSADQAGKLPGLSPTCIDY